MAFKTVLTNTPTGIVSTEKKKKSRRRRETYLMHRKLEIFFFSFNTPYAVLKRTEKHKQLFRLIPRADCSVKISDVVIHCVNTCVRFKTENATPRTLIVK